MKWGKLLWWIFFMSVILACWTDGTVSEDLRWRAVLLYEDDGYSYAKIALLLRLSESSCRRYVRMWYRFHTVRPVRYRRERNPIPPEHMEHLIGLLREDAALYLYEMRSKLEQQFGQAVFYDEKKISKSLLACGYTRKLLTTIATQQDALLRGKFKRLMTSGDFHPDQCIYIDEVWATPPPPGRPVQSAHRLTLVDRQVHSGWKEMGRRRRGRGKRGKQAFNTFPSGMCRRWSVLAAMNSEGLVGFDPMELGARDGA
jgi:transposase